MPDVSSANWLQITMYAGREGIGLAQWRTYDALPELERPGAVIVPGYDPAVMERFPTVAGNANVVNHRLAGV